MAGSASWEVEVVLSINDLKTKLEEAESRLDALSNGKHEVKLDIDAKLIENSLKKLDKLLDNLGKGSNNFEHFKNLAKQIESITNDVKTLSVAFGKIDDSSISSLLNSINSIDDSLISLSKHFSDIGNNSGAENAVKQAENITRANDEAAKSAEKLADAQNRIGNKTNISSGNTSSFQKQNNILEKQNNILDENLKKRDIISQVGKKETRSVLDENNVAHEVGQFSFTERLQNGQLKNVLSTYDEATGEWTEETLKLSTAFEKVGSEIIKLDTEISKLESDKDNLLNQYGNSYDTSADESLIAKKKEERKILEDTLKLYAQESEYQYENGIFEQRRQKNNDELSDIRKKQTNIQDAKNQAYIDYDTQKYQQQRDNQQRKKAEQFQKEQEKYDKQQESQEKKRNSKNVVNDLTDAQNRYAKLQKRIASGNGLDGDIEEAKLLKDIIEELQKEPILSEEQLSNSQRFLRNLDDELSDIRKKQAEKSNDKQTTKSENDSNKDFNSKLEEAKTAYTELLSLAKQYDNATDDLSRNNIMDAFETKGQEFATLESDLKSFGNSVDDVNDKITKMKSEVTSTVKTQADKSDLKDTLSGRKKEVTNVSSSVDKQLQSLKDIRWDNVSYQSFFDNIKNQASDAARDIKEQISNGLTGDELQKAFSKYERTIESFKEQLNALNDVNSGFNSEKFEGDFGKFSSDLNKYGNLDTEGLQKARQYLQEYKEALADIKSQMNGEISLNPEKLVSDFNQITQASTKFTNAMKQVKSETSQAVDPFKSSKLSSDIKSFYTENARLTLDYVEALKKLEQEAKDASTELERMNISNQFNSIKAETKSKGLLGKSALSEFIGMAKRVITVAGVYDTFQMAAQEFPQKVYEAVQEVDSSMTNLYKVTDESESRYAQFLDKAGDTAKELGRDMSSYIEQTSTWAKLGYDLDDAEELSKLSSIYANVGEVDDDTAVSDMVTAMKAFNIEAENAVTIIDQLNALGNNFATDSAGLGEGLSKSASAMNAAGASIQETLAMLTGISEITQKPGEAGDFIKISSMRIRGMKGGLEELGEEVDDSVDSISKVQTQILNLTKGKVNIFDQNKQFRDYYEIMKDIAAQWNDMASTDQANLTEILFGKNRANQGLAMIQAFNSGQIENAYQTAMNSEDSAQQEQDRWMDSIEAKTQQLKASFQDLSQTLLSSDIVKWFLDLSTNAVSTFDTIIEKVGAIKGAFSLISGLLMTKTGNGLNYYRSLRAYLYSVA